MIITTKSTLLQVRVFCQMKGWPPFLEHLLRRLVEHIDPILTTTNGQSCALKVFLRAFYIVTMIGEIGLI